MSGKRGKGNISFIKPPEPSFLKRLKEQVGFQEGPTIESKRERRREIDDNDNQPRVDFDDEKPVVVQLRPGDLSQEEAEKILDAVDDSEGEEPGEEAGEDRRDAGGKITFKKPVKRDHDEGSDDVSTSKNKKLKATRKRLPVSESLIVKNKGLLSFDDEEHDDD